jgi:predicted MFS family arabinose efflux permease
MNDQELEKTLLETLRVAKENQEYLIKIDRRQRWARNWKAFYWALIVVLALTGYYFAFPYLQTLKESVAGFTTQASEFMSFGGASDK